MFHQKQTTPATGLTFPQATPTTGSSLFGGGAQNTTGFPSAQSQQQGGQIDMSGLSGTTPATGLTFPQATPTTGSSLFGGGAQTAIGFPSAQPQQQQQGFSFPQAQLTTSQPSTGFQLPSANTAGAPNVSFFGSTLGAQTKPATQMPTATQGFGFSTPKATAAAPATTAATGFPFGFSTPAPAASAAPTLTPNFGIGSSAITAPAPTLATATSAPSTTVGFNLGITPQTTTSTGLTFPAPTSTATPTLSFGIGTGMAATSTAAPAFGMAATSTAAPAFGMAATSTAAPAFGLPTATTAAPAFGLPSATTAAPAFGLPSATTAAPAFGLTTAAPAFGIPTATTAAPAFGLPSATTAVTSSAPSSVPTLGGLGGTTAFNIGKGMSLATKSDQLKANPLTSLTTAPNQTPQPLNYKDELIPPQLMTLVESFKVFVKDQKSSSSIVNRASLKQIAKVTEDAELLKRMTMQLERTVNKNKAQNKKLREYVARGIQDSEVVQHLSMDPRGFPADNPLAFEYFRTIVDRFQQQAESLTVELKSMEKHIVCKLHPSPFTPEELSAIMKQLYECFVALAGRYQSIHSSVTSLKLDLQRKKDPWYALNSMGYYQSNTMLK